MNLIAISYFPSVAFDFLVLGVRIDSLARE